MREPTRQMIMLAVANDPEVTREERDLITAATNNPSTGDQLGGVQVLTPQRVAELFGKSRKWVDWEAKREGTLLRRVYLGGTRSAGFSVESVKAALAAATSPEAQAKAAEIAKATRARAAATIAARKGEEVAA